MTETEMVAERDKPATSIIELKVSGNLMTLDTGLWCIVNAPSRSPDAASGLPGVRVSVPPGPQGRPEAVSISSFRHDGWLGAQGDAALVRVAGGPAQVLVTIYKPPGNPDAAPNLQVLRLLEAAPAMPAGGAAKAPAGGRTPAVMDAVAHIQGRGDVGAVLGEWLGEPGSKRWIEGFAIAPTGEVTPNDIEYQAVLGRGWLSPWVEGGQFCGSRGMALPVLGMRLRLRGAAAEQFECAYEASFVDGTKVGPVKAGEACEAESLAAMEAFQIVLHRRGSAPGAEPHQESQEAEVRAPRRQAASSPAAGKSPPKGKAAATRKR